MVDAEWYGVPVQGTVNDTMERVHAALQEKNHVVQRWALAPLTRLRLHHELTGGRGDAVTLVRIRTVPVESIPSQDWRVEGQVFYIPAPVL